MDTVKLFQSYIDVCNKALEFNRDRFPYNHILSTIKETEIGNDMPVAIRVINDQGEPHFFLRLNGNQIVFDTFYYTNQCCNGCDKDCSFKTNENVWVVRSSYLENVILNKDEYIKNPAKLNWEWISV